jgi:hypothetical protein
MRLRDPVEFDPRSLRTKTIKKDVKLIVGCPKGKFREGVCAVGTMPQSLLKQKVAGRCPAFRKPYKYVK